MVDALTPRDDLARKRNGARTCAVDGCEATTYYTKDYCRNHDYRHRKYGDPTAGKTEKGEPLAWLLRHVTFDGDECLIWPFLVKENGYGRLRRNGKQMYAHSFMCSLAHGKRPAGRIEAAHDCGNRACVNPRHLRWDTTKGNAADRERHGTVNKGERNGQAKLTEDEVRQIKAALRSESQRAVAKRFAISRWTITDIARGRRWGWVA